MLSYRLSVLLSYRLIALPSSRLSAVLSSCGLLGVIRMVCPFLLTLLCSLCVLGTGLVDTVVADAVGGDGFEESEI